MTRIQPKIDIYNQDWNKLLKKGEFRGLNINKMASDLEAADANDVIYRANSKRTLISFGNTTLNLTKIAKGKTPWSFSRLIHWIKLSCSDEYKIANEQKIAKLAELIQEKLKIDKVSTPEGKVEFPLIKAVEEGDLEQVIALINSGANYDIEDKEGRTPLMFALAHKYFHIAHALLDVKAKVDIEDSNGLSTLMLAAKVGDLELFEKILSEDPEINKTDKGGLTALVYAASQGHLKICERLMEFGAEADLVLQDGDTLLMHAVNQGYHEIVKKLIEKGADVNTVNNRQLTPLGQAAFINNNPEMIRALLESGVNVNAESEERGVSYLMGAIERKFPLDVLKLFIEKGVNVNAVDEQIGFSTLTGAVLLKAPIEFIEFLIEKGADINYLFAGETILDYVKKNRPSNYRDLVDLIKSKGPDLKARSKEFKKRKQLSHVWSLDGSSSLNKKNGEAGFGDVNLEGADSHMWFHQMKKNLPQFVLSYPGRFADLNVFENALDFGASQEASSDEDILQRIKDGLPTFISTGYSKHAVTILVWEDQLLICNRGNATRRPLESYHFDQTTLTLEKVNKIRQTHYGTVEDYTKLLTTLSEVCSQTEQDLLLENSLVLQDQTVGNCSWVSPITAVCGMLLLAGVRGANADELASRIQTQIDLYRTWIGFEQIASIEQMMKLIPDGKSPYFPDHDLIEKVLKSAHLTAWDEILTAKLNTATEIYIQSLTDTERDAFLVNLEAWKAERLIDPREIIL